MASVSEAAKRAVDKYNKQNIRQYTLKINRRYDPDLIEWLDQQESVQGYLNRIIRADYEAHNPHPSTPEHEPEEA